MDWNFFGTYARAVALLLDHFEHLHSLFDHFCALFFILWRVAVYCVDLHSNSRHIDLVTTDKPSIRKGLPTSQPAMATPSPRHSRSLLTPLLLLLALFTTICAAAQTPDKGYHSTWFDPKYNALRDLLVTPVTHPHLFSVRPSPPRLHPHALTSA